jgi:hypothetical protein
MSRRGPQAHTKLTTGFLSVIALVSSTDKDPCFTKCSKNVNWNKKNDADAFQTGHASEFGFKRAAFHGRARRRRDLLELLDRRNGSQLALNRGYTH